MKTLHYFKISEDSKKFDMVELVYDDMTDDYIVRWKWTTMREPREKDFFDNEIAALEYYKERKEFAKECN